MRHTLKAVAATAGMFIVLLMGTTVTNNGSAEGCGRSWPLSQGRFIPEYAFETMVEYSHRVATGIEGPLIAGLSLGARLSRGRFRAPKSGPGAARREPLLNSLSSTASGV